MNKKTVIFFALAAVAGGLVGTWLFVPQVREPWDWDAARKAHTASAYREYLAIHPAGPNALAAWKSLDECRWQEASTAGTLEAFQGYLAMRFPDELATLTAATTPAGDSLETPASRPAVKPGEGLHFAEARQLVDDLRYAAATKLNTIESYQQYLKDQPQGAHTLEAVQAIDDLRWAEVGRINTVAALQKYLQAQPEGRHVAQAQKSMEDLIWFDTRRTGTIAAFQKYLELYPQGENVAEARKLLDKKQWETAQLAATREAYEKYLQGGPQGAFRKEANEAVDDLDWAEAERAGTIESCQTYLGKHADGRNADRAKKLLDELQWKLAKAADTAVAYRQYLESNPSGAYITSANQALEALLKSDKPFDAADRQGTQEAYEKFLADHPGHVKSDLAKRYLAEIAGLDLVDLVGAHSVAYEAKGAGLESVTLRLKRGGNHSVSVRIPAGTFWESTGTAETKPQSMAVRAEATVVLDQPDWVEVPLPAVGVNRLRPVPHPGDLFTLQAQSAQRDLNKLLPVAFDRKVSYPVAQAAAWMVADNCDYGSLSTVTHTVEGKSVRLLDDDVLARAMQLCTWAAIEITDQAIWKDREKILTGVKEENTHKWLEEIIKMHGKK